MSISPLIVTTGPGRILMSRDAVSGLPVRSLVISRRYERAPARRIPRTRSDRRWPARSLWPYWFRLPALPDIRSGTDGPGSASYCARGWTGESLTRRPRKLTEPRSRMALTDVDLCDCCGARGRRLGPDYANTGYGTFQRPAQPSRQAG